MCAQGNMFMLSKTKKGNMFMFIITLNINLCCDCAWFLRYQLMNLEVDVLVEP